jgi:uncharacterized protein with von Willebrand factor type A (vWA) domain
MLMAATIPDCWSEDIKVDVLPPVAVLKAQEGLLAQKAQGMLQAKVTATETEKLVQHGLDLIAPALNFYRERLLSATHDRDMPYPVTATAEAFAQKPPDLSPFVTPLSQSLAELQQLANPSRIQRRAATDEDFVRLVQEVLRSDRVRALIHSLIACINGMTSEAQANGPTEPSSDRPAG